MKQYLLDRWDVSSKIKTTTVNKFISCEDFRNMLKSTAENLPIPVLNTFRLAWFGTSKEWQDTFNWKESRKWIKNFLQNFQCYSYIKQRNQLLKSFAVIM